MLRKVLRTLALGFAVGGVAACDTTTSPTAPTTSLTATLGDTLGRAIQDEYRAEAIYQGVLNDFGPVVPFANVLTAEERHSASIGRLYVNRGERVPASAWSVDTVPHFSGITVACAAGAIAERENIAMYDDLLRGSLPDDVRQVFSNNRRASLENHLPAFERCS